MTIEGFIREQGDPQPPTPEEENLIHERIGVWKREAEIEFFPRFDLPRLHEGIAELNHPVSISSPATMSWDVAFEYAREVRINTGVKTTFHSAWRKFTHDGDVADKISRIQFK